VALLGWIFVFLTSGTKPMLYSLLAIVIGVAAFLVWSKSRGSWPFAAPLGAGTSNIEPPTTDIK
jgi:quinol-cytochrome oxidoreductase complex cytochrome b subunit